MPSQNIGVTSNYMPPSQNIGVTSNYMPLQYTPQYAPTYTKTGSIYDQPK